MFAIYQITNKGNQNSYVGFTTLTPPNRRWQKHIARSKKGDTTHLHCAIRKYGIENFIFEVLEEGWDPNIGLTIREPYWIFTLKPEYNETLGGEGTLGWIPDKKWKEEVSKRQKGISKGPCTPSRKLSIAKNWSITSPSGEMFVIRNLKEFCKERGLNQGNLVRNMKGHRPQYKGWTCKKL